MILLQPYTAEQIQRFLENPTHGLLLSGPEGSGKTYVARHISARLLGTDKLDSYPHFRVISPEKSALGIDQIRELQKFLQLKTPGKDGIRRIAVIEHAHLMTNEAQNALLKSLEEPPADTVIMLTAPQSQKIKETIYSRVRQLPVLAVSKDQAAEYFKDYTKADVEKTYMMSGGHVGLMHAMLKNDEHELAAQIIIAKQLIAADKYTRLAKVDELAKQKETLPIFLHALKLISSSALRQASQKGTTAAKRWHKALQAVYDAEKALPGNPNTKLLLTDLMLDL